MSVVVEGHLYLPFKVKIEGVSKEDFDKLEEIDKQKLINEANQFKKGVYYHGNKLLFTYDGEEYGEL